MRQALHIFTKDVNYLWLEACLVLALAGMLGWVEVHSPMAWLAEILWMLAATFIIARVIHVDAIPGHNQFWITRPYRWNSMLEAKLLFIFLFVNLPVLGAQMFMVHAAGFTIGGSLPGLIWSNFLFILCFSLPVATLAVITPGIAPFLFTAFVLLSIGLTWLSGLFQHWGVTLPFSTALGLGPVDWFRKTLAIVAFACTGAVVIYGQYRSRKNQASRICAAGGVVVALVVYLYTPWPLALGIQSRLSKQRSDPYSFGVALNPQAKGVFPMQGRTKLSQVEVILPLSVTGIGEERELQADAVAVKIVGADGRTWDSGLGVVDPRPNDRKIAVINKYLLIDPDFFERESTHPITLQGTLYMTIFGDPQFRTISLTGKPVNVMNSLQCGTGFLNQLYCRSIFRWPGCRVDARFGEGGTDAFTPFVSYSPFPATLAFSPFEQHWASTSPTANQATIITKTPLSHFRRDFEIKDVRLTDFTREAQSYQPGVNEQIRPDH